MVIIAALNYKNTFMHVYLKYTTFLDKPYASMLVGNPLNQLTWQ